MPEKLAVGLEASQIKDFPSYERLLWRTLARLAHSGYFVPPDESRDVIHDFYVEAWSGLLTKYEPRIGAFAAYVAGAFHKFARRRLVQLDVWRGRLVDLELLIDHPSGEPSPADEAESSQALARIRVALASLPGNQRQVLVAYLTLSRPSERAVAIQHHTTRHAIRQSLAEGLANLSVAFQKAGFPGQDALIAQLAWRDGRISVDIADLVNVSVPEVRLKRVQLACGLIAVANESQKPTKEGASVMAFAEFFKQVLFDLDRPRAKEQVAEHAESIRRALMSEESASIRFSEEERAFLREHPERLGDVYEAICEPEEDEIGSVALDVDRFERNQLAELVSAFENMAIALPGELTDWGRHFTSALSPDDVEYLLRKPVMQKAGPSARALATFGLTPEVFAETFGGFSLLLEQAMEGDYEAHDDDQICLVLAFRERSIPIAMEDLVAQTRETPGLPQSETLAKQLAVWSLSALRVLPLLIPDYRVSLRVGGPPLVDSFKDSRMELGARWSWRAAEPDPDQAVRPRFRR